MQRRAGKTAAQAEALVVWLESVVPTSPFTLADVKALYDMIRNAVPTDSQVEVHATDHRFTRVHVLIQSERGVIDRILDVR
jgi:hypothetical protein